MGTTNVEKLAYRTVDKVAHLWNDEVEQYNLIPKRIKLFMRTSIFLINFDFCIGMKFFDLESPLMQVLNKASNATIIRYSPFKKEM